MADDLQITSREWVSGQALTVRTARASGPGGQHVNRTETKVHLRFDPAGIAWLDAAALARLYKLAGQSVDSDGCLYVISQEHREKEQNLESARTKLKELLQRALIKPKRRIPTKPTRASKRRRVDEKKHRAKTKAGRGKVSDD
jgi:ribosome-associated protein